MSCVPVQSRIIVVEPSWRCNSFGDSICHREKAWKSTKKTKSMHTYYICQGPFRSIQTSILCTIEVAETTFLMVITQKMRKVLQFTGISRDGTIVFLSIAGPILFPRSPLLPIQNFAIGALLWHLSIRVKFGTCVLWLWEVKFHFFPSRHDD